MQSGAQYLQNIGNRLANMSDSEILAGLVAVALLSGYLLLKRCHRVIHRPPDAALWPGKPINVSNLKPRIEGVRLDYLRARQPSQGAPFHRSLLALARRTVAQLAYFQGKEFEQHPQR